VRCSAGTRFQREYVIAVATSHPLMAVVARALRRVRMARPNGMLMLPSQLLFQQGNLAVHVRASCGTDRPDLKKKLAIRVQNSPSPKIGTKSLCCKDFRTTHSRAAVGACDSAVCSASAWYSAQQLCLLWGCLGGV
jgi:hypothetical protein